MTAIFLLLLIVSAALTSGCRQDPPADRWLRGNLHTHSLWSDGDDFPESIIQWYSNSGYDFVALSDHDTLAEDERWIEITERRRLAYDKYLERFGEAWLDQTTNNDTLRVRLKTFVEYAARFDRPDSFLVIQAQEITDRFAGKPLHINATNVRRRIEPQGGASVTDVMQRNIDAVLTQRLETGEPMIPHINHPNFGWAVTPDDMVPLTGEHFFEVYNGHPAVHNEGDDSRPGTEPMWDYINTERLHDGGNLLYGLAVDDAHAYHEERVGLANTGRGWIMVRSNQLSASAIIEAMEYGDFYASSGVSLAAVTFDGQTLDVDVAEQEGVRYQILFIGTRAGGLQGETFHAVDGVSGSYTLADGDLYVRATIISDRLMPNPYRDGETEKAWVQPVQPHRSGQ